MRGIRSSIIAVLVALFVGYGSLDAQNSKIPGFAAAPKCTPAELAELQQLRIEKWAREVQHAVAKSLRQSKHTASLLAWLEQPVEAASTVVTVAPALRAAGTYEFQAPQPVPANLSEATFTINLNDALDKRASGKSLTWEFDFSSDGGQTWQFGASSTWASYGPGGATITLGDGTVVTDPDPQLGVGLATRAGQLFKGTVTINQPMTAGVTINVQ